MIERKSLTIELKGETEGAFIARFATLDVVDKGNDISVPGSFPVGKVVPIGSYQHSSFSGQLPPGKAVVREENGEAIADGQFNMKSQTGREHYETVKFLGGIQEWSYAYDVLDYSTEKRDGKDVRIIKSQDVLEICPVVVGEGINTALLSIKSQKEDVELKPYPNEHSCRLRDPGDFQKDSFKRTKRKHDGKEYSIISGRLKDEDTMTEQAYRYSVDTWEESEAKSHCKEHDGTFEPAEESPKGQTFEQQAESVLAAVSDLYDRSKSLADLRRKEGRTLSTANRNRLSSLLESLSTVATDITELLEATSPDKEKSLERDRRLKLLKAKSKLMEGN